MLLTATVVAEPGAVETVEVVVPAGAGGKQAVTRRIDGKITLDGRLDEEEWQTGEVLTGLEQYQPRAGDPMTEKTEVRILHDRDHLYLGVRCYDRNPEGITARGMERDGSVLAGDYVYFFFDTFHDRRNGYAFGVSPDEGRWDALVSNNFNVNVDWDGIWDVRCTVDAQGWTAEIQIPFKSIGFDRDSTTWGFNFSRWIARKGEGGRWVDPRPEVQTSYAANAGTLTGLQGISQGLGVEFSPYVLGRWRDETFGEEESEFEYGADLRYRITPSLNFTMSYNMDFAETEVDQRQINFSRFPLFFPEKRDFFLEDSGIYEVGGLGRDVFIPYYSRRIGLAGVVNNRQVVVPIEYAAKLSGRVGPYDIGVTAAQLGGGESTGEEDVFVVRGRRRFGDHHTLGVIGTSGNPNGGGTNSLGGLDYTFQTSSFLGDQTLALNLYAMRTRTRPGKEFFFRPRKDPVYGNAYGMALSYPNDRFNFTIEAAEIDEDFNPALGFIERRGVRRYASNWRYLWRAADPTYVQWLSFIYANKIYTDLDNELLTGSHSFFPLVVRLGSSDEFSFGITHTTDRLEDGFLIPEQASSGPLMRPFSFIPEGEYDMWSYVAKVTLAETRSFGGEFGMEWGDFYGGDFVKPFANLYWIPQKHLAMGVNYERYQFDMPDAQVNSDILSAYLTVRFSPRARWSNWVQYDSLSETIGWNSRFSWEMKPGQEMNLVFSQFYWNERTTLEVLDTEVVLKGDFTIRF